MIAALLVLTVAFAIFWLVFFRFKLIRLTPGWGVIFGFFVIHLMLVFLIGLRFITPYSTNATVVQRTIQVAQSRCGLEVPERTQLPLDRRRRGWREL